LSKDKTAVFIGRFQPLHNMHLEVIKQAMLNYDKLIVLVGSSNSASTCKNPLSFAQRNSMLTEAIESLEIYPKHGVYILPIEDNPCDTEWVHNVRLKVASYSINEDITLVGCEKDSSSFYLRMFPSWRTDFLISQNLSMSSTDIRTGWYSGQELGGIPAPSQKALSSVANYKDLQEEFYTLQKIKSQWVNTPYKPIFQTVDAVVLKDGCVLVVTRKNAPGKGLYALPGGFVEQNERLYKACVREIKEETSLDLSRKSERSGCTFDKPDRSNYPYRIITTAFRFVLDGEDTSGLEALDDACGVQWLSLNGLHGKKYLFHDDHYFIIQKLLGEPYKY
jgi:bifunctional NMN adenylyltransferase/nudix hydrolase